MCLPGAARLTLPEKNFGFSAMFRSQTYAAPSHSAVFGLAVVEELKAHKFSQAQIVGNTGIRLGSLYADEPRLNFDALALLFERAAELLNDELLGFRHGQAREIRLAGMLAYISMSSPTVRDCILSLARFMRVFSDALEIDLSRLEEDGSVEWEFSVPVSIRRQQYVEFSTTGLISDLRYLTRQNLRPRKVEFRHSRRNKILEMEKYFGCTLKFGSPRNKIHFEKSNLDLPLITADNHLHALLQRLCEAALAERKEQKVGLIVSLEREIADRLPSGTATQDIVAKAIGMSARTLSRKLAIEGTSFFQVVEGYRQAAARNLIEETSLHLTEIAFMLGYSDLSSFSTAFKRWTGQAPSKHRKSLPV